MLNAATASRVQSVRLPNWITSYSSLEGSRVAVASLRLIVAPVRAPVYFLTLKSASIPVITSHFSSEGCSAFDDGPCVRVGLNRCNASSTPRLPSKLDRQRETSCHV